MIVTNSVSYISHFLQTQIRRFGIPQREIGVSDKNYSIFLSNFLTLLVKGAGGGGGGS